MALSDRHLISRLTNISRHGHFTVREAAAGLGLTSRSTSLKLGSLVNKGWVERVRRGVYVLLPVGVDVRTLRDEWSAWEMAQEFFGTCYIGGWSAARHWALLDTAPARSLVITSSSVRSKTVSIRGHEYRLFRVPSERANVASAISGGAIEIKISSPERTIIDCLRNPIIAGGIDNIMLMMKAYAETAERDFEKLLATAESDANGAAWKRLGYLSEVVWPERHEVISATRNRVTTGTIKLDPSIADRGRLIKRWGLWINAGQAESVAGRTKARAAVEVPKKRVTKASTRKSATASKSRRSRVRIFVYECPYCTRRFELRRNDGKLDAHENNASWNCPGRTGLPVA